MFYIIVDKEKKPVEILIQNGLYAFISDTTKDLSSHESTLLGGHLDIIANKKVVIQINYDSIFEGNITITLIKMQETGSEALAIVEEMFLDNSEDDHSG